MNQQMIHTEMLESRTLLAATATLGTKGLFSVVGTDAGETIAIALSSDATKVQATVDGTVVGEADVASVKWISVDAGLGDDTVTVDAAITQRVFVKGGDGADTITLNNASGGAFGGAGNDIISEPEPDPISSPVARTTTRLPSATAITASTAARELIRSPPATETTGSTAATMQIPSL